MSEVQKAIAAIPAEAWEQAFETRIRIKAADFGKSALKWPTRDLRFLPIEVVRPTGVDSWVIRIPGVEREVVLRGDEMDQAFSA